MKKCLISIFSVCALVVMSALVHLAYLYTHRDCIPPDFQHDIVLSRKVEFTPDDLLKAQVVQLLNQKFVYCGQGRQMTVFESEDRQYVIKFFNTRTFLRKEWFHDFKRVRRFCSLKWLSRAYFKRGERLERLFQRHDLAFQELRDESGIIYAHLNPTSCISQSIDLVDRDGSLYHLSLDETPFILQKKAKLCMEHFCELLASQDDEAVRQAIVQLHHLFKSRAAKGFTDRIQTLHNNYGFVEGRAIQIDLGGIIKDHAISQALDQEILRIFSAIALRYPQLGPFIF